MAGEQRVQGGVGWCDHRGSGSDEFEGELDVSCWCGGEVGGGVSGYVLFGDVCLFDSDRSWFWWARVELSDTGTEQAELMGERSQSGDVGTCSVVVGNHQKGVCWLTLPPDRVVDSVINRRVNVKGGELAFRRMVSDIGVFDHHQTRLRGDGQVEMPECSCHHNNRDTRLGESGDGFGRQLIERVVHSRLYEKQVVTHFQAGIEVFRIDRQ